MPLGHPLLVSRRVKLYDGERVGWLIDYIPDGVLPFESIREEFAGSALDVLLDHPEVGGEYADTDLAARQPAVGDRGPSYASSPARRRSTWTQSCGRTTAARSTGRSAGICPSYFRFSVRRRRQLGRRHPGAPERGE